MKFHAKIVFEFFAVVVLLPASAIFAQQGPAGLWVWEDNATRFNLPTGPSGSFNSILTLDETVPSAGGSVLNETIANSPEIEFGNGFFFGMNTDGPSMEVINSATGLVENTLQLDYTGSLVNGNIATGLEFVGSTLYAAVTQAGASGPTELSTIDIITGDVLSIGLTGVENPLGGLAFNGVMYAVDAGGREPADLYTIDLATGRASIVGNTGLGLTGLEFGNDGQLYALGSSRGANLNELFILDTNTGAATSQGVISNLVSGGSITSSYNAIPEPSTAGLVLLSLVGLCFRRNRK